MDTPLTVQDPTVTRLVVRYSGNKFIVVVPWDATFKDVKNEIVKVYSGLTQSPPEPVSKLCDGSGCALFDDYKVRVLLSDMAVVYALNHGENFMPHLATPLSFSTPFNSEQTQLNPAGVSDFFSPLYVPPATHLDPGTEFIQPPTTACTSCMCHTTPRSLTVPGSELAPIPMIPSAPTGYQHRTSFNGLASRAAHSRYLNRQGDRSAGILGNSFESSQTVGCELGLDLRSAEQPIPSSRSTGDISKFELRDHSLTRSGLRYNRTISQHSKRTSRKRNSQQASLKKSETNSVAASNTSHRRLLYPGFSSDSESSVDKGEPPKKRKILETKSPAAVVTPRAGKNIVISSDSWTSSDEESSTDKRHIPAPKHKKLPRTQTRLTNFLDEISTSSDQPGPSEVSTEVALLSEQKSPGPSRGDSGSCNDNKDEGIDSASTTELLSGDKRGNSVESSTINHSSPTEDLMQLEVKPSAPTDVVTFVRSDSSPPVNESESEVVTDVDSSPPTPVNESKSVVTDVNSNIPAPARVSDKLVTESSILAIDSVPQYLPLDEGSTVHSETDVSRIEETQDLSSEVQVTELPRSRSASPVIPLQGVTQVYIDPVSVTDDMGTTDPVPHSQSTVDLSLKSGDNETANESSTGLQAPANPTTPTGKIYDYSTDMSTNTESGGRRRSARKQRALQRLKRGKKPTVVQSTEDTPSPPKKDGLPQVLGLVHLRQKQYQLSHLSPSSPVRLLGRKIKPSFPPKQPVTKKGVSPKRSLSRKRAPSKSKVKSSTSITVNRENSGQDVLHISDTELTDGDHKSSETMQNDASTSDHSREQDKKSPNGHDSDCVIKQGGEPKQSSVTERDESPLRLVDIAIDPTKEQDQEPPPTPDVSTEPRSSGDSSSTAAPNTSIQASQSGSWSSSSDSDTDHVGNSKSSALTKPNKPGTSQASTNYIRSKDNISSDAWLSSSESDTQADNKESTAVKVSIDSEKSGSSSSSSESDVSSKNDSKPTKLTDRHKPRYSSSKTSPPVKSSLHVVAGKPPVKQGASRFLFTSRSKSKPVTKSEAAASRTVSGKPATESSDPSSDSSSDTSSQDSGGTKVGKRQKKSSLAALLDDTQRVYHPILRERKERDHPSIKIGSFSSMKPLKTRRVKIDQSHHRVHTRAAVSVGKDVRIDEIPLSQQEAELAKTGSKNLKILLDNEQLWN